MSEQEIPEVGKICLGWWRRLTNKEIGKARADLARLKRAPSLIEALALQSVYDLNTTLEAGGFGLRQQPERLAAIAMALARVKENSPRSLAQRLGQGEPKPFNGTRFQALIRSRDTKELTLQVQRALACVNNSANVAALGRDIYWWNDRTRARWCFDYHDASDAAPEIIKTNEESEA